VNGHDPSVFIQLNKHVSFIVLGDLNVVLLIVLVHDKSHLVVAFSALGIGSKVIFQQLFKCLLVFKQA
jgi:hypothetical protein